MYYCSVCQHLHKAFNGGSGIGILVQKPLSIEKVVASFKVDKKFTFGEVYDCAVMQSEADLFVFSESLREQYPEHNLIYGHNIQSRQSFLLIVNKN